MDSYSGNRSNGKGYSSGKGHSKTYRSGRSHDDEIYSERERNDDYGPKKSKKPEFYHSSSQQQQQQHHQKSDRYERSQYDNRRQGSEPRVGAGTGSYNNQEPIKNSYGNSDRSRDTRSLEPGLHYSDQRNPKPPIPSSQHRISNAALQRLPANIDILPPRLKKKYLLEAGLPESFGEKPIMDGNQSGGRGRNNRYDQNSYHQQKYNNSYQPKYNNQNQGYQRPASPPPVKAPLHQDRPKLQTQQQPQVQVQQVPLANKPTASRYDWNEDSNFDWNDDVMNSQSLPPEISASKSESHNKHDDHNRNKQRRRRNRSASSNGSVERSGFNTNENFPNNNFKAPFPKPGNHNRPRRSSQSSYNSRENSTERGFTYGSRENSLDRRQMRRSRYNGRRGSDYQSSRENSTERFGNSWSRNDSMNNLKDDDPQSWRHEGMSSKTDQKIAELTKEFKNSVELNQRTLFDPSNPSKPIVVNSAQNRLREYLPDCNDSSNDQQQYLSTAKPIWFKKSSEQYKSFKNKQLIDELDRLDHELMTTIDNNDLLREWNHCQQLRQRVQSIFIEMLDKEMRFCQQVHVEHYFWKLLFYRIIEVLRKNLQECDESLKASFKEKAIETVDGGTRYLESLLKQLETSYNFSFDDFIGENAASYKSGLGPVGLALVSAQKIFLFLGDLARYREQINQTNNFGRAKNFYTKAQQVVPKNGKPFNQLALLAVYSKRKIDAVYFYMRSLMSVSPFNPARESLVAVFDEIRKKYEFSQRKRDEKNRSRLKEKEHRFDGNLRKETWIHPEGGSRVHRTAPLDPSLAGRGTDSSEDEELHHMDAAELNKRFVISFLHVQGKLITRIGMESFQTCAIQMLKEFRALLQISPITINSHRLLQLISLNMYAIACTELRDPNISKLKARSELQECAIAVGLLMFGIILERFIEVLEESTSDAPIAGEAVKGVETGGISTKSNQDVPKRILTLNEDAKVMLPPIKVWCDWMMFNVEVWNPPPFCSDYKIGAVSNHDPWNGLATLMTLLETIVDTNKDYLSVEKRKDDELVRLQEDVTLAGFTPLKGYKAEAVFCRSDIDIEPVQNALRLQKVIFFGTSFLCKQLAEPILTKVQAGGKVEYKSVVQNRTESASESEILLESFSDEEDDVKKDDTSESNGNIERQSSGALSADLKTHDEIAEIRRLLRRKDELERKQKMEEKYNERLQDILSQSIVALHIEVRPRLLVPDTNCFVDDLISIQAIAVAHPLYQLMIPITVISELEGLCRGLKPLTSTGIDVQPVQAPSTLNTRAGSRNNPNHAAFVVQASKDALVFLKAKNPAVKYVTTQGNVLMSATFTSEEQTSREQKSNDDKILDTALNLCKKNVEERKGEVRHLLREVVLLTNDRNLRVKALTKDIPVRELQDFIKWAGLGPMA